MYVLSHFHCAYMYSQDMGFKKAVSQQSELKLCIYGINVHNYVITRKKKRKANLISVQIAFIFIKEQTAIYLWALKPSKLEPAAGGI